MLKLPIFNTARLKERNYFVRLEVRDACGRCMREETGVFLFSRAVHTHRILTLSILRAAKLQTRKHYNGWNGNLRKVQMK